MPLTRHIDQLTWQHHCPCAASMQAYCLGIQMPVLQTLVACRSIHHWTVQAYCLGIQMPVLLTLNACRSTHHLSVQTCCLGIQCPCVAHPWWRRPHKVRGRRGISWPPTLSDSNHRVAGASGRQTMSEDTYASELCSATQWRANRKRHPNARAAQGGWAGKHTA